MDTLCDVWFAMLCDICRICQPPYQTKHQALAIIGVLLPIIMGGLIELAQAYCTGGNRSGDWIDWIANSIGVMIGTAIGSLVVYLRTKARKDI